MRVAQPMPLDFAALADGVRRNNVGVAGISVQLVAEVREGRVRVPATGQSWPLAAEAADAAPSWRNLRVREWDAPARTTLLLVP